MMKNTNELKNKKLEERNYVEPRGHSDLVGAHVALSGIKDSLTLLNSPIGCATYIHGVLAVETRDEAQLATTGLAERDVIFGGEEILEAAIEKGLKIYNPSIICVVGSTASTLIGDDVDGIVGLMQKQRGGEQTPIINVHTSALEGDLMTGFNQVLEALVNQVVEEPTQNRSRTVNIFGVMSYKPRAEGDVMEMKRLLGELGIEVQEVFCHGAEVARIRHASEASLNLVISEVLGVKAAQDMEQRFGQPYRIVPYPIGITNTKHFLQAAADFFGIENGQVDKLIATETETVNRAMRRAIKLGIVLLAGNTVAVIGESTHVLGVTRFLMEEWRAKPVLLALKTYNQASLEILTKMTKELGLAAQVLLNPTSAQIRHGLAETNPEIVLGGMFEQQAVREVGLDKAGTTFVQIDTYPTSGQFAIFPHPFAGFRGVIYLTELIISERARARKVAGAIVQAG